MVSDQLISEPSTDTRLCLFLVSAAPQTVAALISTLWSSLLLCAEKRCRCFKPRHRLQCSACMSGTPSPRGMHGCRAGPLPWLHARHANIPARPWLRSLRPPAPIWHGAQQPPLPALSISYTRGSFTAALSRFSRAFLSQHSCDCLAQWAIASHTASLCAAQRCTPAVVVGADPWHCTS